MRRIMLLPIAVGLAAAACSDTGAPVSDKLSVSQRADAPAPLRLSLVDPPAIDDSVALSPVANGNEIIATWIEPVGGDVHRVRFARLDPTTRSWGAASTVVESRELLPSSVDFPVAARAASGAYFVTILMRGREPHASSVHLATSRDGRDWRVLGPVHDDATETEHGHASLFIERDVVRAVWLDGRAWVEGGPMAIRTAVVGAEGAITDASVLDARVCDCCQTTGIATRAGTLVAYRDRGESELRDIATVRGTAEGWTTPRSVHADGWTISGCPVNGPRAAASEERVALAWYTEGGGTPRVRIAFSDDSGAHFDAPIEVDASHPFGRVDVEWARDGTALVSWLGSTGPSGAVVLLRRIAPDRRLGEVVEVARIGSGRPTGVTRLARFGSEVLVAWTEAGPPRRVRAALVDPGDVPAPTHRESTASAPPPPPRISIGATLPDLRFVDLDGAPVSLASYRGKPVVLSFFATWCEPCRAEYPLLSRIAREHGDEVRVVGVSLDEASLAVLAEFARAEGLGYTVLHDPEAAASGRRFGVPPIPATFVFDARGELAWSRSGGGPELLRELPAVVASSIGNRTRAPEDAPHRHDDHEHEH